MVAENALDLQVAAQREIEYMFAACANLYPVYTVQQCGWLNPAIISDPSVRSFWTKMVDRLNVGMADDRADAITLQAALETDITQELTRYARTLPDHATPNAFAVEIDRRSYLTRITAALPGLWKSLQAGDDLTVKRMIDELKDANVASPSDFVSMEDIDAEFTQIVDNGGQSLPTYIGPLDLATSGTEKKTVTVIAGRPGMGKTALGLQIARNNVSAGKRVIFYSLEMSAIGLWARMACPMVPVQWRDVLAGKVSAEQKSKLKAASATLKEQYAGKLVIADGRHTTESVWRGVASTRPDLVVIDHLRYLADHVQGEKEVKRMGRMCSNLHDMSKQLDLPVILLAQLNRGLESQNDKRPELKDLRDSGEIEEEADNVWMLYRPDYYKPEFSGLTGQAELWVRKYRNGPSNILVNLSFDAKAQWFDGAKR